MYNLDLNGLLRNKYLFTHSRGMVIDHLIDQAPLAGACAPQAIASQFPQLSISDAI
jgi:hypothetical protein